MCRLLETFWEQQEVVTRQNGYCGPHFRATRRKTQCGLISLTLFNFIINNVASKWLVKIVEDQMVAQEGLVLALGKCLVIF